MDTQSVYTYTHTSMIQYWYSVLPLIFLQKSPAMNPAIPHGSHQSFLKGGGGKRWGKYYIYMYMKIGRAHV